MKGIAQNFNEAFKALKFITALAVALLFISNIVWFIFFSHEVEKLNNKIFVVSDNGTMTAVAKSEQTPSIYEAKNHVKTFMQMMFAHDAETFKDRINIGLKLIERTDGLAIYEGFKRGQVLENYSKYNSRTLLEIDSIQVNVAIEPYNGVVYARQIALYQKEKSMKPIAARFELIRTYRSEDNPFGLLLKNFTFIGYNPPIKTREEIHE